MSRVFVSYVKENQVEVSRLAQALELLGIYVWLDSKNLHPGMRWKDEIREGIVVGDFFLACFSSEYSSRERTYMNEELALAVDELRLRPHGRSWFIPVKLNSCEIPHIGIGGGETLTSLQHVELFPDWGLGFRRLLRVLDPGAAHLHELLAGLGDESARVRIRAADAIGRIGPLNSQLAAPAIGALTRALDDSNDTVRAAAADALGRLGEANSGTIEKLLNVIRKGEHYSSKHAVHALGRFGKLAIPALQEARQSTDSWISHLAAETLREIAAVGIGSSG